MNLRISLLRLRIFVFSALVLFTVASLSTAARANNSAENKAAARELALEGIQLAQAGKCEAAIPKLRRAEKLFHAPTILTWIGECLLQQGQLVEGTEVLRQVVREKLTADAPDAYSKAQRKSQRLLNDTAEKIGKLTIRVESGGTDLSGLEGLEVSVNEKMISEALVGAPRPTDPGEHHITANAPGYVGSSQTVALGPGEQTTVTLILEPKTAPSQKSAQKDAAKSAERPRNSAHSGNLLAWSLVGGGAALVAGGGVTGYLALSKKNDLSCSEDNRCAPEEQGTLDAANLNATLSTVLFGVGGAAAVTGVILLLTGEEKVPSAQVGRVEMTPQLGVSSIGFAGTF